MVSRAELLREAWSAGNLEYQIDDYQLPVYHSLWQAISDKGVLKYVCNISRRFGKTHISSIVAVEYAIRFPGSQINYACVTDKAMKKILRGIFPTILEDCPKEMLPKRVNGTWEFPNGSVIYTAGVNNGHADDLRGTASDLNIVDEAGQIDELEYLVRSVLLPQQLTVHGTMLLLSTPPTAVDHDYTKIYHECLEEGNVSEFTVYDNAKVMADPELFASYVKESGGKESTHWLREYEVKFVTDTNKIILPEWADVKEKCVREEPRTGLFKFWHKHVSMDLGFKHNTCLIFGYYDFSRAKLVIEDELVMNGEKVTSEAIATGTKDKETELWGTDIKTLMRVSDNNNPILLNDIHRVHDVLFHPTSKDELHAMIGQTRLFIAAGNLEVHPRCKYLLGCLEFGVWDKHRTAFAESRKYGHYDALACLVYGIRYLDVHTNPVPIGYGLTREDLGFSLNSDQLSTSAQGMKNWSNTVNKRSVLRDKGMK